MFDRHEAYFKSKNQVLKIVTIEDNDLDKFCVKMAELYKETLKQVGDTGTVSVIGEIDNCIILLNEDEFVSTYDMNTSQQLSLNLLRYIRSDYEEQQKIKHKWLQTGRVSYAQAMEDNPGTEYCNYLAQQIIDIADSRTSIKIQRLCMDLAEFCMYSRVEKINRTQITKLVDRFKSMSFYGALYEYAHTGDPSESINLPCDMILKAIEELEEHGKVRVETFYYLYNYGIGIN